MTAVNTPAGSEHDRRGSYQASSSQAETMSNADLYTMTPPAYALSATDNEVSLDAEAVQDGKTEHHNAAEASSSSTHVSQREHPHITRLPSSSETIPHTPASTTPTPAAESSTPTGLPPVYFQELTKDAAIVSVRKCSVLPTRPAVWLVKKKDLALSPLVATVLIKEGILRSKDLELEPNDPLSGIAFATYDTIGDILLGLIEGPVEAARQVSPLLAKHEKEKRGDRAVVMRVASHERTPLFEQQSGALRTTEPQLPRTWSGSQPPTPAVAAAPNAAKEIALSTGKGLGRIVGAGLKSPMTMAHGITRGFHNLPKLYGDEVREYENVTDLRSGLGVSVKSLGHGISDGMRDLFVQPIVGAQKEGGKGLVKGFGKGVGNFVCKPSAGLFGLIGYSFQGVYKELQGLKIGGKGEAAEVFLALGETEYNQIAEQTRLEVVRRWCQMNMRQR